jgi:hypothetical protein
MTAVCSVTKFGMQKKKCKKCLRSDLADPRFDSSKDLQHRSYLPREYVLHGGDWAGWEWLKRFVPVQIVLDFHNASH